MEKEKITTIEMLNTGDLFRTPTGGKTYRIVDIAFPHNMNCKVWLLDTGHYVKNPLKEVVKV